MTLEAEAKSTLTDKLGIFGSTLSLIHCLVLPFFLPLLSAQAYSPHLSGLESFFHGIIFPILLSIAVLAFSRGYKQHHSKLILTLGISGVSLLFSGLVVRYLIHIGRSEIITASGSALLIVAHLMNVYRLRETKSHVHSSNCGCKVTSEKRSDGVSDSIC